MSYLTSYNTFSPLLVPRTITSTILGSSLGTAQEFTTVKGYVTNSFKDATTGYTWSFALTGGYTAPNLLTCATSALFAIPSTAVGCTVTPDTYTPRVSTT